MGFAAVPGGTFYRFQWIWINKIIFSRKYNVLMGICDLNGFSKYFVQTLGVLIMLYSGELC